MKEYIRRFTLTPVDTIFGLGSRQGDSKTVTSFNWSYQFRDGSRLVGKVNGQLDRQKNNLLNLSDISADYIAPDGKTVLLKWQDGDFACFDLSAGGTNLLIVASNDNFVENSMSLVCGKTRSWSQVTDAEQQLIGEPFRGNAWSLVRARSNAAASEPSVELNWELLPFYPFVSVSVNFWLLNPKTRYQWTFFPYFPLLPCIRVAKTASSS